MLTLRRESLVQIERDLPEGWKVSVDEASGRKYFWNEQTGAVRWDRPEENDTVGEDEK